MMKIHSKLEPDEIIKDADSQIDKKEIDNLKEYMMNITHSK